MEGWFMMWRNIIYRDGAKQGPQVFVFSHTLDTEVLVTVLAQAHPGGKNFGPENPTNNCPPETTLDRDY